MKLETLPPELRDVVNAAGRFADTTSVYNRDLLMSALAALEAAPDVMWTREDFVQFASGCMWCDCGDTCLAAPETQAECSRSTFPRLGGAR